MRKILKVLSKFVCWIIKYPSKLLHSIEEDYTRFIDKNDKGNPDKIRFVKRDIKKIEKFCKEIGLPDITREGSILQLTSDYFHPYDGDNSYQIFIFEENKRLIFINEVMKKLNIKEFYVFDKLVKSNRLKKYNYESLFFKIGDYELSIVEGHDDAIAIDAGIVDYL